MRTRHVLALSSSLLVVAAACSESPPPPKTPAPPMPAMAPAPAVEEHLKSEGQPAATPGVSSADATSDLAAIASAEAQINALAFGGDKKKEAPAKSGAAGAARAEATGASSCASACSALGSMTRATEHLCSLTGEADARCSDARVRTRSAEARVKGACAC